MQHRARSTEVDQASSQLTHAALRNVATKVTSVTGENILQEICRLLADSLEVDFAYVGALRNHDTSRVETLTVCLDGSIVENLTYNSSNTPCERVLGKDFHYVHSGIQQQYPGETTVHAGLGLFRRNYSIWWLERLSEHSILCLATLQARLPIVSGLFDVIENAVEFLQGAVGKHQLALARAGMLNLYPRSQSLGDIVLKPADIRIQLAGFLRRFVTLGLQSPHQRLGLPYRQTPRHNGPGGSRLLFGTKPEQRLPVAHLQISVLDHRSNIIAQ